MATDEPLPQMPELKANEATMEFVTNRRSRRAMAKRDGMFKKEHEGKAWPTYNKVIKEAK